ncbi:type II secretion system protein GspM [Halochromatium roseum]|uniref:type II secretion system protein GspM n=1 Tax=Halochromatium roseum TaxID=391920 RepID=UPI001F5E036D|nr:type II secretion system protein GspM [Halochromatium roseum]
MSSSTGSSSTGSNSSGHSRTARSGTLINSAVMGRLSQRQTCIALLSALVLLPLGLALLIALGWMSQLQTLERGIQDDIDRLQRYQRLLATLPALQAELEAEQANDAFKAFYFDADTPSIAGAQLQSQVQDMVRSAGARPVSTQVLPTDEAEVPPRVRVRIQLQGTTDQLFDVLYRIESARPFLLIDQLSIRSQARSSQPQRRRPIRSAPAPANQDQLTVRLDIFGYFLSPSG